MVGSFLILLVILLDTQEFSSISIIVNAGSVKSIMFCLKVSQITYQDLKTSK